MKAKGELTVSKWDEMNCGDVANNMIMARASIVYNITGDIQGEFNVEYLLHYTNYNTENQHNSEATYTGYMAFSGAVNGKSGTFVLEDKGTYSATGPVSDLTIKPNTGTGDLSGISGTGRMFAEGDKMVIELDYTI